MTKENHSPEPDHRQLEEEIRASLKNGKLPCRKAFSIAGRHQIPPAVIGKLAEEMGIKISGCQLGCFP